MKLGLGSTLSKPTSIGSQGGIYSVNFDASSDYIDCTNTTDFQVTTGNWSAVMWIKATDANDMLFARVDANDVVYCFIRASGSNQRIELYHKNTNVTNGICNTIDDAAVYDEWMHVVCTRTGTNSAKIYINGVLGGTTDTLTANISSPTAAIQISRLQPTNNYQGDGWYTNVLLYNRAFTQSEITQNYNAQKSRFGK